jgi:hypothetical protein
MIPLAFDDGNSILLRQVGQLPKFYFHNFFVQIMILQVFHGIIHDDPSVVYDNNSFAELLNITDIMAC